MNQRATAEIIQFPVRAGTVVSTGNAAAVLAAALVEQHEALLEWQAALAELSTSLSDLGGSLRVLERSVSR